jgi:hypothetical protein
MFEGSFAYKKENQQKKEVKPLKVYISKHRMFDTRNGWNLTSTKEIDIKTDEVLLLSLFEGWYEEHFYVKVSTYNPTTLRKLKRLGKVGEDVYFGFWLEDGNRLFQVQMIFQEGNRRRKYEIPATLTYYINGFPEIFPIACEEPAM